MGRISFIDPKRGLFSKIESPCFDILVPYVCMREGLCCRVYMPFFQERDILEIAHDLHEDEGSLYRAAMLRFRINMTTRPKPCIFLDENNLCRIYRHPLRPDVCRLYPFSFGGGAEKCSSYREHKRITNLLADLFSTCLVYDSSFCPNRQVRLIPDADWPDILSVFKRGMPHAEIEEKFIAWNHPN